jgi:adenine-specific DNA-methyltransferase
MAKNLKAGIEQETIEAFNGTLSLPFAPGKFIAVKIMGNQGIECLKIPKQ